MSLAVSDARFAGERAGLSPHAIYTVGADGLRWVAENAVQRQLPIQIHLSETEEEVRDCVREHGMRPAHYLDSLGVLGRRAVLGHGGAGAPARTRLTPDLSGPARRSPRATTRARNRGRHDPAFRGRPSAGRSPSLPPALVR